MTVYAHIILALGPPSPPTKVQVIHISDLNYRISWIQPMTTSDRNVNEHSSLSSSVNKLNKNLTKYRIMWAPRIKEPVDESMYNDEIGFSPIMDLQQIDVRVIDKVIDALFFTNVYPVTINEFCTINYSISVELQHWNQ